MANPFDGPYAKGTSEYERYLKVSALLDLQKPADARNHPDELLFQTIHQVEELWMKLIVHELGEAIVYLDADRIHDACGSFQRIEQLQRLCEHQLRLIETMLPEAYIEIRKGLGQGSGLDSPGYNRINEIAPKLWARFEAALDRSGDDLLAIYEKRDRQPGLLLLAEHLVTFDAAMQRFKQEHLMVVRRIIGMGTASLRGNPAEMLERSAKLTYFPLLWAVRERLFADFKRGPLEP
jgi:tryptophan 2,3-dioxygenase